MANNVRIAPGKYNGKLLDYGIGQTKAGLPQIMCLFEFKDNLGATQTRLWFGSLKEGQARNITMAALKVLGFDKKTHDLALLADGLESGILKIDEDVQLTVVEEPDQNGNPDSRIRWVNKLGEHYMPNRVTSDEAKELIRRMNTPVTQQAASMKAEEVPF